MHRGPVCFVTSFIIVSALIAVSVPRLLSSPIQLKSSVNAGEVFSEESSLNNQSRNGAAASLARAIDETVPESSLSSEKDDQPLQLAETPSSPENIHESGAEQKTTDPAEEPIEVKSVEPQTRRVEPSLPTLEDADLEAFSGESASRDEAHESMSASDILYWTNYHRLEYGLPALSADSTLARAADKKSNDMNQNDYFDHVSPRGVGIEELAGQVGYEYVRVGENIARGGFDSAREVVTAWMDSPGHRANILSSKYTEIGVSIISGIHNGRQVWIAVQEFGKPSSACPVIDADLGERITREKAELAARAVELDAERESLNPLNVPSVDAHNKNVAEYNALLARVRNLVEVYNKTVRDYNSCISQ